ncbi:MAG TPA: alpha/beta fold hydrolase [Myxococcota bacterium]|nr:alpha/beta fold hydrolase [Myxococcota bacterium]
MPKLWSPAARPRRAGLVAVSLALAVFAVGCATPVGIRRASLGEVDRLMGENAVTGDAPSALSRQILARLGLSVLYEDDPVAALEKLRAGLGAPDQRERLLALAELWYSTARKTGDRGEYLAAAVCAYAYVFPATPPSSPPSPYDSRTHLVLEIYNRGIARGLALAESDHGIELDPSPRQIQMPFGTFVLRVPEEEFRYGGYRIVHPVALGDFEIRGMRNRYRRPGAGVALAASIEPAGNRDTDPWLPPRAKIPVTAFVRIEELPTDLARAHGTLEFYDADETGTIQVGSATVPLASDPSAALAYRLEGAPIWDFEIAGFRRSDLRIAGVSRTHGLFFLNPYRPGRIPVVFVHGTLSSPARWAEMANELLGDPRIATRFQLWFFVYNSGNPVLASAAELREALQTAEHDLDPEGKDPALRQMVVVGHSQGGLLTKAMVVSSGNAFWAIWSDQKFEDVPMSAETRELLRKAAFFDALPFVTRVIFISTPHHGSFLAENWLGMLARRLVNAPSSLAQSSLEMATLSQDPHLFRRRFQLPTSIDNMDWSNPGLRTLASLPIAPGVAVNSIIPVLKAPIETGDDGVVKYQSAHIEPVESELVVLGSGHSTQANPETIEEVRRILYEHAGIH